MHALRSEGAEALIILAVLAAATIFGSGCVVPLPTEGGASELTSRGWSLVSYRDDGVPTGVLNGTAITLRFEGSLASGSSGCNVYFAEYTIRDSSLRFDPIGQTEIHCVEQEVMDQESAYLDLLAAVEKYRIDGGRLTLMSADGSALLVMEEDTGPDPRPFSGTVWVLESYASDNAVVLPRAGSTVTAVFSADGRVTGSGGCNQYAAEFASNGPAIRVGAVRVASSRSCPAPVAAQEAVFLDLLGSAEEYAMYGDWLSIRAANRTVLSFRAAAEDSR
ncbi:MAG: META domain-containing protein [Methanomicrobiales archaeon]|nr:META domain-containing protein [Methanomicrobiales archaeon]